MLSPQCFAGVLVAAAVIAADLPAIHCSGSSLKTDPQQNDGHGCFRSRGGRWLSKRARKPALVKYEGGIRLNSNTSGAPASPVCASCVKAAHSVHWRGACQCLQASCVSCCCLGRSQRALLFLFQVCYQPASMHVAQPQVHPAQCVTCLASPNALPHPVPAFAPVSHCCPPCCPQTAAMARP